MARSVDRKTALVLSAGGMFGAYQAGAWKALAGRGPFDIVVGASVGALNAWIIAGGASPEELERYWLDPCGARMASFRLAQPPWRGVFDARPLHARLEKLWREHRPRTEVGVVAVDLGTLRPRLFRNAEIGWRHLAASCAVLACYPQIRLGGRFYTDGGLLSALPLWAAAEMGATRIVAVNALPEQPSRLVKLAVGGFRAIAPRAVRGAHDVPVRLISPGRALGTLREALFWNEAAIRRWIAQGEADAGEAARAAPDWP
ncbi:MAG TPA: patatin-like phospholipase family protein [Bryobacteraceae bacterium]